MRSFPGAGRGLGQQSTPHSWFFFRFFNFLSLFLKLSCGCDVFMFIVGFFSFFISKYWKKYMCVISTPIHLPPFAGVRFPKITAKMLMRCS